MSKVYKGYELMRAISKGELSLKNKVNSLSLDYKNCTIDFVLKDNAINIMDLKFELIEENTIDEIEELEHVNIISIKSINNLLNEFVNSNRKKINELVQVVNKLNKEIQELKEK